MSNRLSKEKASAIAAEYTTNGYNQTKALLAVGYKPEYAKQRGRLIMDNVLIKTAIERIQAGNKAKTGTTVELITTKLWDLYDKASQKGDLATCARCLELIGKTIAAFSERTITESAPPPEIDQDEREALKQAAQTATGLRLAKGA